MIKPDYIIRSYRRTLCISISKIGEVVVRAPKNLSMEQINKFLVDKEAWIKLKKEQIQLKNNQNKSITNYEKVLKLGKEYIREDMSGIKKIEWDSEKKRVYVPSSLTQAEFVKKMSKEYIKLAKEILLDRVYYFARLMSLSFNSISIMNNRTRWGTCSKKGDLKFNWRLSMLRPESIDYLIIHELAHLIEFNHSKKFYKVVECVMPKYKTQMNDLKAKGFLLDLYRWFDVENFITKYILTHTKSWKSKSIW